MTSTHVGLPDRYRPLDQVGAEEVTPTGVIHTWRAKDRVLNRDVSIRVHTPGGPAAHGWIARALTAGGLATPALAMVYDAAEGSEDPETGAAAYVVNEWIEGETLGERLSRGPMPEREARTVLRRLAEGVAEAHRVGLAVGGLTPDHVVLRPNGLVGLRGVPAASGTVTGDIAALGELLEFCLTGRTGDDTAGHRTTMAPDLAALVRRARSTEPGQGLSSVAAMAALLTDRPRGGSSRADLRRGGPADRPRRAAGTGDTEPDRPAVPGATAAPTVAVDGPVPAPTRAVAVPDDGRTDGPDLDADALVDDDWDGRWDDHDDLLADGYDGYDDEDEPGEATGVRRRLLVIGLPLFALALVIALAVWFGSSVLSVAGSVDDRGSTPPVTPTPSASAPAAAPTSAPPSGGPLAIDSASVFDPYGDGESENRRQVSRAYDGDPGTVWSTLRYRGSAHFGNLKPGVGLLFDLGDAQPIGGVTLDTTMPGATVEVRTGQKPDGSLDDYAVAASTTLDRTTPVHFAKPVTARFVLVWITALVPDGDQFAADLGEVTVQRAG